MRFVETFHFSDIDECASVPCKNSGMCVDGIDFFACQCMPGFTGDQCQTSKMNIGHCNDVGLDFVNCRH